MTTTGAGSKRRGGPDSPEKAVKKAKAASTKANSLTDSGKGKARAAGEHRTKVTGTFSNDGHSKNSAKAVMRAATGKRAYEIGPVLLNSTDFAPPRDIEYTLHHKARRGEGSGGQGASLEDRLVFSGESDSIDYVAWNCDTHEEDEKSRREARGYSGEYMVGVYDPDNSTVTLRAAPIFNLGRSVKSLTNLSLDASSNTRDWQERMQARRGLGETFGNRKTKLKARNDDRMKVDTSNMLDVMGTMQEGIEEATQHLPSEERMKEEADQARPIPHPTSSPSRPRRPTRLIS
ncbi:hypothetical protein L7F22_029267 [Adiantum nelumboides]|nr:hypothetical protein [Adiantum nelumboides]